jgi:hypothetical protein
MAHEDFGLARRDVTQQYNQLRRRRRLRLIDHCRPIQVAGMSLMIKPALEANLEFVLLSLTICSPQPPSTSYYKALLIYIVRVPSVNVMLSNLPL